MATDYSFFHDILMLSPDKRRVDISPKLDMDLQGLSMDLSYANPQKLNLEYWCEDEEVAQQVREMNRNPEMGTVFFSYPRYHGIYSLTSATTRELAGTEDFWAITMQMNYEGSRWLYHWKREDITTDWDTYEEWAAADPTWIDDAGAYAWAASAMTLQNTEWARSDEIQLWMSDYDIQVDLKHSHAAGKMWLEFRQGAASGNYYWLQLDVAADTVNFIRYPGPVTVRSWSTTVVVDTYYTLRVRCIGDRFDVWLDGVCLTEDEPIIDNLYPSGMISLYSTQDSMIATAFTAKIGKPSHIALPPGDYELNRYYESRQITSRGLNKLLVGPRQPVVFDERNIAVADPNIRADWRFNEGDGTTVYDHSGYKNHLAFQNTVLWSSEKYNSLLTECAVFDTSSNRSYAAANTKTMDLIHTHTLEFIWEPHSYTATGLSSLFWTGSGANQAGLQFALLWDPGNTNIYHYSSTGAAWITTCYADLSSYIDTKIHLVVTFSVGDGLVRIYVNGTELSWIGGDSTPNAPIQENTSQIWVGSNWGGGHYIDTKIWLGRFYQGAKDATWVQERFAQLGLNRVSNNEVFVYDVPKNSMADGYWEDLVLHVPMNEGYDGASGGEIKDISKNLFTGTITSGDIPFLDSVHPSFGTCMNFEATHTEYVTFGDDSRFSFVGDVPFSVGCWVKHESVATQQFIITKYDSGGVDRREWLLWTDSGKPAFRCYNFDNTNNRIGRKYDTALTAGVWYYIVATYDGSQLEEGIKIYVNGVAVDTVTDSAGAYTGMSNTASPLVFGALANPLLYYDGLLDEVVIWKREMTATEVAWLYNNAPNIMDESLWVRCEDRSHEFKDSWMFVDNGQIRYLPWNTDTGVGDNANREDIYVWNGYWDRVCMWNINMRDTYTSPRIAGPILTDVRRGYAEWQCEKEDTSGGGTGRSIDTYRMYAGLPLIHFSTKVWPYSAYWSSVYDGTSMKNYQYLDAEYPAGRFNISMRSTSNFNDRALGDTGSTRMDADCPENWIITFSPERNYLYVNVGMDQYDTGDNPDQVVHASYLRNEVTLDDYDMTEMHIGYAVIPFDTSWLHTQQDSAADKNSWEFGAGVTAVTEGVMQADGITGDTAGTHAVLLNVQNEFTGSKQAWWYTDDGWRGGFPAGAYRFFFRAADTNNIADDLQYGVYNNTDVGWEVGPLTMTLTSTLKWYFIDFIVSQADAGEDFYLDLKKDTAGVNNIYIDSSFPLPISGADFQWPLNIAHSALSPANIRRSANDD